MPHPRHLLVINPNTSQPVTQDLRAQLQAALGPQVVVQAATARFGAPYIADEASYAVASHAALDAWAGLTASAPAPDAVLIGCFGDPGLHALRECCPCPVTGLAEAALAHAARLGDCAVVTGGDRWGPMLRRICLGLPHGEGVKGIVTVAMTGGDMRQNPAAAETALLAACRQALDQHPGVKSLVIGGAALGGWATRLQSRVPVPLIDSVLAGAHHALSATCGESLGLPAWWEVPTISQPRSPSQSGP